MVLFILGYILSILNKKKCKCKYFNKIIWLLLYILSFSMFIMYLYLNHKYNECNITNNYCNKVIIMILKHKIFSWIIFSIITIDYTITGINTLKYTCNLNLGENNDNTNIIRNINESFDIENQNLEMIEIKNENLKFYKLDENEECLLCNNINKNVFYKFNCEKSEEHKICYDCMDKYTKKNICIFCNIEVPIKLKDMNQK